MVVGGGELPLGLPWRERLLEPAIVGGSGDERGARCTGRAAHGRSGGVRVDTQATDTCWAAHSDGGGGRVVHGKQKRAAASESTGGLGGG